MAESIRLAEIYPLRRGQHVRVTMRCTSASEEYSGSGTMTRHAATFQVVMNQSTAGMFSGAPIGELRIANLRSPLFRAGEEYILSIAPSWESAPVNRHLENET